MFTRTGSAALVVAVLLLLCGDGRAADGEEKARGPNVYLYDMGTETSPVWAGFERVIEKTTYEEDRGFGWVKTRRNPGTYVADFTDALAADHVNIRSSLTLKFRHDLPNGEVVHFWISMATRLTHSRIVGKTEPQTEATRGGAVW